MILLIKTAYFLNLIFTFNICNTGNTGDIAGALIPHIRYVMHEAVAIAFDQINVTQEVAIAAAVVAEMRHTHLVSE